MNDSAPPLAIEFSDNELRALADENSLQIFEFDRDKIQTPRRRVRPLPQSVGQLKFDAWRLAHALKKADYSRDVDVLTLRRATTGFLLEHHDVFAWGPNEFRLNANMSNVYVDVSRTSLSGRVGQGITILFLEDRGYAYVARLEAELSRRSARVALAAGATRPTKCPDFLVENAAKEFALAESKGGFISPRGRPNIKGELRDALAQLDGWPDAIHPQPKKNFAVGVFLREQGDPSSEPSLLAFVDPEPGPPEEPIELPPDAVRRANYASWLSFMGFPGAAARLVTGEGERVPRRLPVARIGGREFALRATSLGPKFRHGPDHDQFSWPFEWRWFFEPFFDEFRVEVIGLGVDALKAISVTDRGISEALLSLEPFESEPTYDGARFSFYGSTFRDGTLIGEMQLRHPRPDILESREFEF